MRRNVFRRKGQKCGESMSEGSLCIVHGSLSNLFTWSESIWIKRFWPGKVFNLKLTFQLVKIERQGGLSKYSVICLFLISCSVLGSLGSASGMKEATQHLATFSLCVLLSLFSFLSGVSFFCSAVLIVSSWNCAGEPSLFQRLYDEKTSYDDLIWKKGWKSLKSIWTSANEKVWKTKKGWVKMSLLTLFLNLSSI